MKIRVCTSDDPLRIGVLVSGSGTNLQAILDAIENGLLHAKVVHVVSSRPDAFGIQRANEANVPCTVLNRSVYEDVFAADERIVDALQGAGVEYVVMAGYMRKCTPVLLDAFPDRVVNLHPALLPSFKGAHAIQEAYDAGVKVTGVTVHFANEDYDKGPIIAQEPVRVDEGCTLDELEEKIHNIEHILYPYAIELLAQGRIDIDENRHVRVAPAAS